MSYNYNVKNYHSHNGELIDALAECFDFYTDHDYDTSGCVCASSRSIVSDMFTVEYSNEDENCIVTCIESFVECPTTLIEVSVRAKLEKVEHDGECWVATYYVESF